MEPSDIFWSTHYTRHNQRRQEHLASLGLALTDRTVLEVGAGIGDHTSFFLDRNCTVTVTESQEQNLAILRTRNPELHISRLDLNDPPREPITADIVYCYGTLYHLHEPAIAIRWMTSCATDMLLLETCVAAGEGETVHPFEESAGNPDNSTDGYGCRPTRSWIRRELAIGFAHVYIPLLQPSHEEFPLDWSRPELADETLIRAVFVASHLPIVNPLLTEEIPMTQMRK